MARGSTRAWFVGCLIAAAQHTAAAPVASAAPADSLPPAPTPETIAAMRADFEATATPDAIDAVNNVGQALDAGRGQVTADRCRQRSAALDAATRADPLSMAAWYFQNRCAKALGDDARARWSEQALAVVLRDRLAGLPPDNGGTPIEVGSAIDGSGLIYASGEQVIYSYFDLSSLRDGLLWRVGLRDDAGHERALSFDVLSPRLRLLRQPNLARTPALRLLTFSKGAEALREGIEKDESIPTTLDGLDEEPAARRDATLAALEAHASLSSAIVLARYCVPRANRACTGKAVDHLLGYAEKGYAEPMLVLAYAYAHARDIPRDLPAAKALLQGAAKKIGTGKAWAEYLRLDGDPAKADPGFAPWLLDQALAAADKDDALAAAMALKVVGLAPAVHLDASRLATLRQQAEGAGLGYLVQWQAMVQADTRHDWLAEATAAKALYALRAPGSLRTQAASMLGDLYFNGAAPGVAADPVQALHWLTEAGQGGNSAAMQLVGAMYADQPAHPESMQLAAEWLSSAVLAGDSSAVMVMAAIAERDPPGFATAFAGKERQYVLDSREAARIYEDIIRRMPGKSVARIAARRLALMLVAGHGVARDPARARAMLTADAQAGDAQSALLLAALLNNGLLGARDPAAAKQWLARIEPSLDGEAAATAADLLYLGADLPPDRERALMLWKRAADKGYDAAWNEMAWTMCTAAKVEPRDAAAGMDAARKAVAAAPTAARIDTLAACQAATGDFAAAMASQKKALAMLDPRSNTYARMRERMGLYAARHHYIQPLRDTERPAAAPKR